MITLHYLQCSRSFRILWALEELGMDYQVEYYQRLPSYAAPESLKQIHPLGKAPILVDDEMSLWSRLLFWIICNSSMMLNNSSNRSNSKISSNTRIGCTTLKALCLYW